MPRLEQSSKEMVADSVRFTSRLVWGGYIINNTITPSLHGRGNAAQFVGRRSAVRLFGMAHTCAQYPTMLLYSLFPLMWENASQTQIRCVVGCGNGSAQKKCRSPDFWFSPPNRSVRRGAPKTDQNKIANESTFKNVNFSSFKV